MTRHRSHAPHRYFIYGVQVSSDLPFEFPAATELDRPLADVEFVQGTPDDFARLAGLDEASDTRFLCRSLSDGTTYLRWAGLYEFSLTADGSRVASRPLAGSPFSVLQNYLFGQVLSAALVRQGIETLHATVVRIGDEAVGFLGDSTFGKSTLLAAFLQAGHRTVTDDMLVIDRRSGDLLAMPGGGRIRLTPDSASVFLDPGACGTPLVPGSIKWSFPVEPSRRQPSCLPLRSLYVLPEPQERERLTSIEISPISRVAMVQELLKNTFTTGILDAARLARQFAFTLQLASDIDGYQLRYPSGLQHLPSLRRAVVDHAVRTVERDGDRRKTA